MQFLKIFSKRPGLLEEIQYISLLRLYFSSYQCIFCFKSVLRSREEMITRKEYEKYETSLLSN